MGRCWIAVVVLLGACGRVGFSARDDSGGLLDDSTTSSNDSTDAFDPRTGLIAYWPFDEGAGGTAQDVTGNGHAASLKGGAGWAAGKLGTALALNGTTAYATAAQDAMFDIGAGPYSIALWIRDDTPATTLGFNTWHRAVTWHDPSLYDHTLGLGAGTASANTRVFFGTQLFMGGSERSGISTGDMTLGWHHVVSTVEGTTSLLYVDGLIVGGGVLSNSVSGELGTSFVNIGQKGDNTRYVAGELDDVRIYNRALTATEVGQIYRATGGS